jgi:regulator of sigma E protease
MHEFLVAAAAFIVLVGIMVLVHEFGHFAVAKLCGVRVEAFSFGFGPRIFGIKYGDTDYKICLLPLGGYVKMTGENFGEPGDAASGTAAQAPPTDPGAFTSHPRWQRMLIGLAGPTANFVLAFGLMLFYFGVINEVPAVEIKNTTVEWVIPGSPAAQAGIQPGDVVQRFDTQQNPTWDQAYARAQLNLNQTIAVTVSRNGAPRQLSLHVPGVLEGDDLLGMLPQFFAGPIGVHMVQPGTPADQAGLRAGDAIQAVDGHPFHTVSSLLAYLQIGKGTPVTLQVSRKGVPVTLVVHPAMLGAGYMLGFQTVPIPEQDQPLPFNKAWTKSARFCKDNSLLIVEVLQRLFTHRVSVSQLSGPVGIARMAGDAAEMRGWMPKFYLAGEISLNLGIINLLPFPILDGGMILFLLIEGALRRDIAINIKERIYQAAFVLLVAFFAFVIFNDVTKLPIFTHLKQ